MRYFTLLLGFLYLGLLAFVPHTEARSYCYESTIWTDGVNTGLVCPNEDEDESYFYERQSTLRRDGRSRNRDSEADAYRYIYSQRQDDRRYDSVVRRYSEPESRLIYDSPLEQYFATAPFRAKRAQLHPYFRNSPLQGYAPAYGLNHPGYRVYANDQIARQALGLPQPIAPSAACRNYTVFRYAQKLPAFLESCN